MKTMRLGWLAALVVATLSWGGCGGAEDALAPEESAELAQQEAALSTTAQSFVVVRRDMRRCASPYCGGYFVKDANRATSELYVSDLDLRYAGLDEATRAKVREAPAGELVLRGFLSLTSWNTGLRRFFVTEAYRGMPGVVAAAGETFFRAAPMVNPPMCFTAPCPGQLAQPLNATGRVAFDGYAVQRAQRRAVDAAWLTSRVQDHGAIVSAVLRDGEHFPGGYEKVLDASQVFVRLPDVQADCRMYPFIACEEGYVTAWSYDADRCLNLSGCVPQAYCFVGPPTCEDGYTLRGFTDRSGCATGRCEPAFLQ